MKIYVVKQADSVDSIAESQGIPVETLVWANQIEYPYRLAVGQALYISDGEIGEGRRPLFSSGYAYPFIAVSYTHSEPTRRTPISYAVFCLKKKKYRMPTSA